MAMSIKKLLRLSKHDRIVTAYAQHAAGPGWANSPLWVIVRDGDGKLREECIQPEERTPALHWLYDVAAASHRSLMDAMQQAISGKGA